MVYDMKKVVSVCYDVFGFKFDNEEEALSFEANNVFVWDEYDECYLALERKDVDRYTTLLSDNYESLCKTYRDLANSNSMGALYPLAVIRYVFEINGKDLSCVWDN